MTARESSKPRANRAPGSTPKLARDKSAGRLRILLQKGEIIESRVIRWFVRSLLGSRRRERDLLKRAEEFQPKDPDIPQNLLPAYLGHDGRRFARDQTRGGCRRSGDCKLDHLIVAKQVRRRNTGAARADVQRFCELDEFRAGSVGAAKEDRYLKPDTRVRARLRGLRAVRAIRWLLQDEVHEDSTQELVQVEQVRCHFRCHFRENQQKLRCLFS